MKLYLLEAVAAIDWVEERIPDLRNRIDSWLKANVVVEVERHPDPNSHDPVNIVRRSAMPSFNIEVGAYLNVLRSSLDIMACALAREHGYSDLTKVYFPVERTAKEFRAERDNSKRFLGSLPTDTCDLMEALQPYHATDAAKKLSVLHSLDNERKHRNLLAVEVVPRSFNVIGFGNLKEDFVKLATGWIVAGERTTFGLLRKGSPPYTFTIRPTLTMSANGWRRTVIDGLRELTQSTSDIVKQF